MNDRESINRFRLERYVRVEDYLKMHYRHDCFSLYIKNLCSSSSSYQMVRRRLMLRYMIPVSNHTYKHPQKVD